MKNYFKERVGFFVLLFFILFLYLVSFWLFDLPAEAVWYPSALCLICVLLYCIVDYGKHKAKHELLQDILDSPDNLADFLTRYDTVIDRDYQELISVLTKEKAEMVSDYRDKLSDMTDYYTTWAHQIKTPIASMRLALADEDTPVARKVHDDLFRIEQYVGMVMGYLRLNSEYTDYVIREVSLDKLLKGSIRAFRTQFINKGLRLNYSGTDQTVVTDEKWLAFVIEQVLSNSLKYTLQGSITIAVTEDELVISDTGIGIAQEDLPRIFEKGYTGFNGRKDKKASGLGLYLCSRVCKKLGHSISADSKLDQGTTIRIGLKRNKHLYD